MGDEHGLRLLQDGTLDGSYTGWAVIRDIWRRGPIGRCWSGGKVQWITVGFFLSIRWWVLNRKPIGLDLLIVWSTHYVDLTL